MKLKLNCAVLVVLFVFALLNAQDTEARSIKGKKFAIISYFMNHIALYILVLRAPLTVRIRRIKGRTSVENSKTCSAILMM